MPISAMIIAVVSAITLPRRETSTVSIGIPFCPHYVRTKSNHIIPRIVVDEGQDLPPGCHAYLNRHCADVLTVFADEDQALSDQHTTLEQIKKCTDLDDPVILGRNHRNRPEVARLAEHFHSGRLPAASVVRERSGEPPQLERTTGIEHTASLVANLRTVRGGSVGVIVHQNDTGEQIYRQLTQRLSGSRVNFYRHEQKNDADTNVLEEGVTVINKESVKGQEFRLGLHPGARAVHSLFQ